MTLNKTLLTIEEKDDGEIYLTDETIAATDTTHVRTVSGRVGDVIEIKGKPFEIVSSGGALVFVERNVVKANQVVFFDRGAGQTGQNSWEKIWVLANYDGTYTFSREDRYKPGLRATYQSDADGRTVLIDGVLYDIKQAPEGIQLVEKHAEGVLGLKDALLLGNKY